MRQFRLHFFPVNRFSWLWTTFIPIFRDFPSFVMTIRPVENSLIWSKMVPFFEVFGNYFKNGSNDFDDFLIWCSFYIFASSEKNCMSSKHPVQKLFSPEKSKNQLKPYYIRGDFWRWSVHFHGSENHLDRFKIVKTTTIPNFKSIWSLFNVLRPVKVKQNRSKIA